MNLTLRAERAANRQSRVGLSAGKTAVARAFGVDPSNVSHWSSGRDKGPIFRTCTAVMSVECDDAARLILTSVQQAFERRPLLRAATPLLMNRWGVLFDREHILMAEAAREEVIYMAGGPVGSYYDALAALVSVQSEAMELLDELECRGVDTRAVLLAEPKPRARK